MGSQVNPLEPKGWRFGPRLRLTPTLALLLMPVPELLLLLLAPKEAPSKGLAEAQEVRMASEAKNLGANIWERMGLYKAVRCRRSVKTREPESSRAKAAGFYTSPP